MSFLKGLALTFLGFLLVLSLSVFASLFTLNSTVLNPDFVVAEIDKVDVSSLVEEVIQEEALGELSVSIVGIITKLEPLVKEQISAVIYPVYDYLQGRSENLDLALVLGDTFLSSDFIASLLDRLDMSLFMGEFLSEQIFEQIPAEEFPEEYRTALVDAVDDAIAELEPTIKEELVAAADPISDYLLGRSQSLSVVISLEPVVGSLEDSLREAFLASLPPELADLPPAELGQLFDEFFGEFAGAMPSTFEIDESVIGTEVPTQIAEALAEAEEALAEAREYVGYLQLGYNALIVFIVLLLLGIVFIHRQVKGATRGIGSTFLTFGVPGYIAIFVAKYLAGTQLTQLDIPVQFQTLLQQLVNDFLAPLQTFCLGLLIAGVALLIVSFVYKPRQPSL